MKTQKNTVKSRLETLLIKSGLDLYSFSKSYGLEYTTLNRIFSGETETLRQPTIKLMADKLRVNYEWLAYGKGTPDKIEESSDPWKDALVKSLSDEVAFYRQLLMNMTGGKAASFLQALNGTGLPKKRSLRAAA